VPGPSGGLRPCKSAILPTCQRVGHPAVAGPTWVAGNVCAGCTLYSGAAGAASGPCSLFPGKQVMATGWCSGFIKKPA
jgi:hypothetical protein